MELSRLIAKLISVIYISSGLAVLFRQVDFKKIADDFEKSAALIFFAGTFGIILGMILVQYHNIWVKNWTVLITIISWLMLVGGVIVVIFPKSLSYMSKFYKPSPVWGIFMICFGLLFGYFGFML